MPIPAPKEPEFIKAPLVEAVFDLYFRQNSDYSIMVGKFNGALQAEYPISEITPAAGFPNIDIIGEPMIRHRFLDRSRESGTTRLFQTGRGVIAMNQIDSYSGFAKFYEEIRRIIEIAKKDELFSEIVGMQLRYINKLPAQGDIWAAESNWPQAVGETFVTKQRLIEIEKGDVGVIKIAISEDKEKCMLDIAARSNASFAFEIEKTMNWVSGAHDVISEAFNSCLSASFLDSIRRK